MSVTSEPTVLAEQSNHASICTPNDILDGRAVNLRKSLLLLKIVQDDSCGRAEKKRSSTTIEDLIRLHRWLDGFSDGIREIANRDRLEKQDH